MRPLSAVQAWLRTRPGRIAGVAALVLALGTGWSGEVRLPLYGPRAALRLAPLAPPAAPVGGRLHWLGGARLYGSDAAFGGFSALAVRRRADGDRIRLLSDGGNFVDFTLGADWRARAVRFGNLPAGPGRGWDKRDRDSESMALDPAGRAWVGFERANAIWRYAPGFARAERRVRPAPMVDWDSNGGPESLARLADGRFVVLAETAHWPRRRWTSAGIVFARDPVAAPRARFRFSYRPERGYDPVDLAQLPDGDLLVLERRWLLPVRFRSRLAIVPRAALRPGAVVTGREVGRLSPPFPTENYEGLAVTRERGATIVWLVSDDDQSWWRAAYLVKLRLDPAPAAAAGR